MTAETMAEVLEELWDGGNATGLDGWIGPGRGAGEVDDHAIDTRRRDVEKALSALSAAGFGLVADQKRTLQLAALMAYDAVEEGALREAGAKALENAADDSRIRGDIGKDGGVEAWDYLRARAAAVRGEDAHD